MSYRSDNFREACLGDKKGKNVKEDRLFLNFYDYGTMVNAVIIFDWFYPKIYLLAKKYMKKIKEIQRFTYS